MLPSGRWIVMKSETAISNVHRKDQAFFGRDLASTLSTYSTIPLSSKGWPFSFFFYTYLP